MIFMKRDDDDVIGSAKDDFSNWIIFISFSNKNEDNFHFFFLQK